MTPQDIVYLAAARQHAASGTGKAIRKAARISLAEIAQAVGVAEPTVWRWEEGHHRPRSEAAIKWARVLADLSKSKAVARR